MILRTNIAMNATAASGASSFSTLNLLYFLECQSEAGFVGSRAILFNGSACVYIGMVESISFGHETTALRISDLFGNPKIPAGDFPAIFGRLGQSKLPVEVTKTFASIELKMHSMPLDEAPAFYLKTDAGEFIELRKIDIKSRIEGAGVSIGIEYEAGFTRGAIKFQQKNVVALTRDAPPNTEIALSLANDTAIPNKLRGEHLNEDTPDYYGIGAGDDFEKLEVWSNAPWASWNEGAPGFFIVGRDVHSKRRHHKQGDFIFKMTERELWGRIEINIYAESITFANVTGNFIKPPFQTGNPSQLYLNSRENKYDFEDCPRIRLYNKNLILNKNTVQGNLYYSCTVNVKVKLSSPEIFSESSRVYWGGRLIVGFKCKSSDVFKYTLNVYRKNSQTALAGYQGETEYVKIFPVGNVPLSDIRDLTFQFVLTYTGNRNQIDTYDSDQDIVISHVRLTGPMTVLLDGKKLYASGQMASADYSPQSATVIPILQTLLGASCVDNGAEAEDSELEYGNITKEGFSVRDKLRSLAAESAMLVKISDMGRQMKTVDISLHKDPDICPIPLDAFALDGNRYAFKMESPERSELLSGLDLRWGKDIETGKFEHTLSISKKGNLRDGNEYEGAGKIPKDKWDIVFNAMSQNDGMGEHKTIDAEWIISWEAAERMAYNILRWNTAPMLKAEAACIFPELELAEEKWGKGVIDIGTFVRFSPLPGYHDKLAETAWVITGRHDDFDSMVTKLELLEASGLPAVPPSRCLLLEDGRNIFLENKEKIKMEGFYG